jgi:hypothetical protein
MEWVTAETILTRAGAPASPSAEDSAWAAVCADAVNAGLDARLEGAVWVTPPPLPPELVYVAQIAGVEAYKRREAVFGITGYVDLQGAAVRIARDYLEAQAPIIARYATFGLA